MNPSCRSMSFVGVAYKSSDVGRCVGPVSLALWVMVALMRRVHESRGVRTDSWVCLLKVVDRYVECPRRLHRASHIVTEGHPDDIGRLSDHHAVGLFDNSARLGHASIARRGSSVWAFFFWIPFSPPLDRASNSLAYLAGRTSVASCTWDRDHRRLQGNGIHDRWFREPAMGLAGYLRVLRRILGRQGVTNKTLGDAAFWSLRGRL